MPRLSIVIPCAQDTAWFESTLASVLQNRPADCEVLVVQPREYDDPYDDDLVGAAEEQLDRVIGPRPASAVADAAAEACARVVSGACRGIADPESLAS